MEMVGERRKEEGGGEVAYDVGMLNGWGEAKVSTKGQVGGSGRHHVIRIAPF